MKGLKITRLKLTAAAAAQLEVLGLTLTDLVCVICFAREAEGDEAQTCRFDIERVPEDLRGELQHLAGVELRIISGAIVGAMRLARDETNTPGSLKDAGDEIQEEKP